MGGACSTHGRDHKIHTKFKSKNPNGKRQLEKPRRRWEDYKNESLGNRVGSCRADTDDSGQGPVADFCEPSGFIKVVGFLTT
jgi:hypothetical protein